LLGFPVSNTWKEIYESYAVAIFARKRPPLLFTEDYTVSLSINTNVAAIGVMNNLDMVTKELGTSENRLSTGMRINSSADDPSGLIESQSMDQELGGYTQALQNGQQAINYVKTADGALNEVNTLLNSAYSLAVAASNTATVTTAQAQADQQQLESIASSISTIASQTTYGTKHLLDGSAGVQSSVTAGSTVSSLNIGGDFGGAALSSSSTVTLNSVTAATQATVTGASFATINSTVAHAGSFTLNGTSFNATSTTTAGDLINEVNAAAQQTGVTASYQGGAIVFNSTAYGTGGQINLVDSAGVVASSAGTYSNTGTAATASVTIGGTTSLFTGSLDGNSGLTLEDSSGNTFSLTVAGNTTTSTAAAIGQVNVGSAQFQIGGEAGQTASLSLQNFSASNLGSGAVSGLNMSNLDLTSASGASNAMQVIEQAITQVSSARGSIGNFQTNVLQAQQTVLTTAQQNLTASLSTIEDTNIASEMTQFTQLQILQQSGISILGQANQEPQQILSLIKNG
jgi:flagellin